MPALMYAGIVGPRGDAYETNRTITAEEAEEYHSEQLGTLARAAARTGLPLAVTFTLDHSTHRLVSGPTVKDAIETVDAQTAMTAPRSTASTVRTRWSSRLRLSGAGGSSECVACDRMRR